MCDDILTAESPRIAAVVDGDQQPLPPPKASAFGPSKLPEVAVNTSEGPSKASFDPRLAAQHHTAQRVQSEVRNGNQAQAARGPRARSAKRNNAPPHESRRIHSSKGAAVPNNSEVSAGYCLHAMTACSTKALLFFKLRTYCMTHTVMYCGLTCLLGKPQICCHVSSSNECLVLHAGPRLWSMNHTDSAQVGQAKVSV